MWQVADHYRVRFGGNTYIDTGTLIEAHGKPLLELKRNNDGYLGAYFDIFNENGEKLAAVRRNEIYPVKAKADDYRLEGTPDRVAFIEKATGRVLCEIRKRGDAGGQNELEVSARLYTSKGLLIDATPTGTNLGGVTMVDNTFVGNRVAIGIT
jgi:hypothetical protein